MMIKSLCNSCFSAFDILVEQKDIYLLKEMTGETDQMYSCPRLCGGRINLVGEPSITEMTQKQGIKDPLHLTLPQLYRAVHGGGLPDEMPVSGEVVDAMLKANRVVRTDSETHGGHVYLHEITLENGVTLHLSAGLKGSRVLKMTRAR